MCHDQQRALAVLGAGPAGAKDAEAARGRGYDGRIMLIGDEPAAPYERPPLSKAVLRGGADPDSARVHPDGFYAAHDIGLITDRVVSFDVRGHRLPLGSGDMFGYDRAILATGAEPRRLNIPGADLAGVHYLRTVEDAARLRQAINGAIRGAARVAVLGAGWIGSEVAASARQMGAGRRGGARGGQRHRRGRAPRHGRSRCLRGR